MTQIVDISAHRRTVGETTLVLLDMQQAHLRIMPTLDTAGPLGNCLKALRHARSQRFQVAFARWSGPGAFFHPSTDDHGWIEGFTPHREDLVFDRGRPSCYSSTWFDDAISQRSGRFVLAGFSGEVACLSTVIDAFHHNHVVTLLVDATASRELGGIESRKVHRVVHQIADLFGMVATTSEWISRTSCGALAEGKHLEGRV